MEDKITYLYSKDSSVSRALFLLWIIFITGLPIWLSIKNDDADNEIFFELLVLVEIIYLAIFIIRYLIPAFKGKVALEINQQGIIDYTRNTIVEWADMSDLRMEEMKGIATIHLYFRVPNKPDDYTRIRLQWVKGDALEIYGIIKANMEERSPRQS